MPMTPNEKIACDLIENAVVGCADQAMKLLTEVIAQTQISPKKAGSFLANELLKAVLSLHAGAAFRDDAKSNEFTERSRKRILFVIQEELANQIADPELRRSTLQRIREHDTPDES